MTAPSTSWALRGEVALAEELAREEGFRMPRLDESLEDYQAALGEYIKTVLFAQKDER